MPASPDTTVSNPTHELAAIMFSDVVGYTAIMGRDENEALRVHIKHISAVSRADFRLSLMRMGRIAFQTIDHPSLCGSEGDPILG